jgi:hypothetical protein
MILSEKSATFRDHALGSLAQAFDPIKLGKIAYADRQVRPA